MQSSLLDAKVYIRNVKFLTRAPIAGQELTFDDILDSGEERPELSDVRGTDNPAKDAVVRTRSRRVSKPTRSKDFEYY